jgi:Recombinase zinc beta ribbon domain/Recombinase
MVLEEAQLVVEAFERCARGESVEEISAWLNVERGADKDKRQTWTLLHKRVYLGEVRSTRGDWIKATWAPIVTRDLFERVQAALVARRKSGGPKAYSQRTNAWLLRGLGSCPDCGARMGAAYGRGDDYYACGNRLRHGTCQAGYARVERVDPVAADLALARLVELRLELARPSSDAVRMGETPKPIDFATRRRTLDTELTRAETLAVRGTLSEEGLRRQRERVDEERGRLAVAEAAAERAVRAGDPLLRRRVLAEVARIGEAWSRAPVELRRAVLGILVRRIVVYPDTVRIEWKTVEELACTATGDAHLFFTILTRVLDPTLSSLTLMGPMRRTSMRTLA